MFTSNKSKGFLVGAIVLLILFLDQWLKIWVKTHFAIGESISVSGSWFQLLFIENKGMAFGMFFGGDIGKLVLSLFRIVLVIFLIFYVRLLIKNRAPIGVLIGISLIIVGALGNIIDCAFYGMIFSDSTNIQVAQLFPPGGGYASFLHGKVVDMLYFPFIDTTLPNWFPIWGGQNFIFFRFIFNIADSAITTGILYLLIFQWRFFGKKK
ncbi:MAG: lipoprotein signal peptidase [Prevotellaceae bacterium]|nr:lipoprotein signal peptidase [Prevotellaceae bacterium]